MIMISRFKHLIASLLLLPLSSWMIGSSIYSNNTYYNQSYQLNRDAVNLIHRNQLSSAIQVLKRANSMNRNSAEILGNLGYAYYLSGDLARAQKTLYASLQHNPKRGASWNNLGLVFAAQNKVQQAIKCFVNYWNYSTNKNAATNQFYEWEENQPGTPLDSAAKGARQVLGI